MDSFENLVSVPASKRDDEAIRVLCVDDEPRVLHGLENHLAMRYEVHLATNGAEGLSLLESSGPFAVVISDMRMPLMDGAAFLRQARAISPETTRVLLTGQTDLVSAVNAVNEGNIFRFLLKPVPPDDLMTAVGQAVQLYQLARSERELLQNTLNGAIAVLAEVMSLTTPAAFARVTALRAYVVHMCRSLGIKDTWEYELAAALCRVGCITLPPSTLDKLYAGQALDATETKMLDGLAQVGERLLTKIPRMEGVSRMVGLQREPMEWNGRVPCTNAETIALGSNMLALALALDALVIAGTPPKAASERLLVTHPNLNRQLVSCFKTFRARVASGSTRALKLNELRSFMILDEDIVAKSGNILVRKGTELHGPLLERVRHFAAGVGIVEPIRVMLPGR